MARNLQVHKRTLFDRLDLNLILTIFALNIVGLINLYSASLNSSTPYFQSQIVWLVLGWIVFFLTTLVDYRFFIRMAYLFYGLNLIFLVLVLVLGHTSLGAQRWIDLGFFRYQPSETMKLAIVLVMSRTLWRKQTDEGLGFRSLGLPAILLGIPFVLTAKQPDLGTALLLIAIAGSMLFFMKIKKRVIISVALLFCTAFSAAWSLSLIKPYQKGRILTFLNPSLDPRGAGYNTIQAKIAIGSGQIFGRGFLKGSQSQLEFLPERHTDFIFCVLSEEHGFLGSMTALGLFAVLFFILLKIAGNSRDRRGVLITVGILSFLFWHMFINIGMVTGLLPIVGVPLPLLSYGGSSNLSIMAGLGWASSVSFRKNLF